MADAKKVQKKKVTAGGQVKPKGGDDAGDVIGALSSDAADDKAERKDNEVAKPAAKKASGDGPKLTSVLTDKPEGGPPRGTRARTSGRVTEKGTGSTKPGASTRYTPPSDRTIEMPSPWYIPALMFTLWGIGILLIFLNYVELLPGAQSNWYLLGGLGLILVGIIVATQYR